LINSYKEYKHVDSEIRKNPTTPGIFIFKWSMCAY